MATITPYNGGEGEQAPTTLIIGSEGTGKHELAKCLADMGNTVGLKVHTCCSLPLPAESLVSSLNVPFICFMMHIANKDSFKNLLHCIGQVDVGYFLGRSAIIVNRSGNSTEEALPFSDISNIGAQYGIPVLFRNIQVNEELAELGRTLMSMIETALGHYSNITPLLYDAVYVQEQCMNDKSLTVSRERSMSKRVSAS